MRIGAALSAVALLALVPAGSAQAAPAKRSCALKGSKTVVKNRYARVFTKAGAGNQGSGVDNRLYGCMYSIGKRVLLDVSFDDEEAETAGSFDTVRLNGRFVAYRNISYEFTCPGGCTPDYNPRFVNLESYDLRHPSYPARGAAQHDFDGDAFVVTRTGALAWVEKRVVKATDADGLRELDPGPADANSLDAGARSVTWTTGSQPRSATLR